MASRSKSLLLIDPDPNVAGCRLRWLNIQTYHHLYEEFTVQSVVRPSFHIGLSNTLSSTFLFSRILRRGVSEVNQVLEYVSLSILICKLFLKLPLSDIVVFGKPLKTVGYLSLIKLSSFLGKKVLLDFCDFYPLSHPKHLPALKMANIVTCPTNLLACDIKAYLNHNQQVMVIPDLIDPAITQSYNQLTHNPDPFSDGQTLFWFGLAFSGGKPTASFEYFSQLVFDSIDYLSKTKFTLYVVSENEVFVHSYLRELLSGCCNSLAIKSVKWSIGEMHAAIRRSSYVVIPYPEPVELCKKSPNRIELALYYGKRVVSNCHNLKSCDKYLNQFVEPLPRRFDQTFFSKYSTDLPYNQALIIRTHLEAKQLSIIKGWKDALLII